MDVSNFIGAAVPVQPNDSKELHYNAVKAIVQAALNVEEFTIPLYMCSLYSLVGTHQITGQNPFYRGRWWPGLQTSAYPDQWPYTQADKLPYDKSLFSATNNEIFNKIFKVFIEEMLHLQMAGNLAKALGVQPTFTHPDLVDSETYAWKCYNSSVIPYIVDLKDTINTSNVQVQLDDLNSNQIQLFLAIEAPEEAARANIKPAELYKYFPDVPFNNWTSGQALPMFGSIGHMYSCLWKYLKMPFEDHSILLDYIIAQKNNQLPQQNLFQYTDPNTQQTEMEYPGFSTTINTQVRDQLLMEIAKIINAITDQGEGSEIAHNFITDALPNGMVMAVEPQFQASLHILQKSYPSYDDEGNLLDYSNDASARAGVDNTSLDHEELFQEIEKLMQKPDFLTWKTWHAQGHSWTKDLLLAADYTNNIYQNHLPHPADVAQAMCTLKEQEETSYPRMYKAATGAIWGIISVLNDYWTYDATTPNKAKAAFPYPSMAGSGDRMSICWAIYGKLPDITKGLEPSEKRNPHILNHACQGLNYTGNPTENPNDCAQVGIYHTCRGSNQCRAEGGCGFVQNISSGGNCRSSGNPTPPVGPQYYSAPSDNNCGGLGGCAVPISASQLYPTPKGEMNVYDFGRKPGTCGYPPIIDGQLIGTTSYNLGDNVYDKAWSIYAEVLQHRKQPVPDKPANSLYRLAFPPST